MKKMCVVTYVFGKKYQSFIPLYIYSVLRAYPEYDVFIYTDSKLDEICKKQLKTIKHMGRFYIRDIDNLNCKITNKALKNLNISKAMRWFLWEEEFFSYEAIYCGDIDIFVCKEEAGIFEQHMKHCDSLGLPYSNYVRTLQEKRNLVSTLLNVKNNGILGTLRCYKEPERAYNRLSGLHFVKSKEYYEFIKDAIPGIISDLNDVVEFKSKRWNTCNINDESVLYELVKDSGLGLPAYHKVTGKELVEIDNPENVVYRPHHGLHLALWRADSLGRVKYDKKIMLCPTYVAYYKDFDIAYKDDEVLRNLISEETFATGIIHRMMEFYMGLENKDAN